MAGDVLISAAEVARLADVGRAAVSNWRRRSRDFPPPVEGTGPQPRFRRADVERWLAQHGKLRAVSRVEAVWRELPQGGEAEVLAELAAVLDYLHGTSPARELPPGLHAAVEQVPPAQRPELAEELFERFAERHRRAGLGTAAALAALMVELAGSAEVILDPACGAGTILRAAAARGARELAGQDADAAVTGLARARVQAAAAAGAEVHIAAGDSLRADAFADLRADAVVCEPPFGYRDWGYEELGVDPRWAYGFPVKNEPELAWMQHCLARTRPGGAAVLLAPAGVAARRSGRAIRQAMLRRGVLRAVIALPPGMLASRTIPVHLWVLRAPNTRHAAEPVLLIDASSEATPRRGDPSRAVDGDTVAAAVGATWREFTRAGEIETVAGRQAAVQPIALLDEDVDLTPARHIPHPQRVPDPRALEQDRERLSAALRELAEALPPVRGRGPAGEDTQPGEETQVGGGTQPGERTTTTVAELIRAGEVTLRQQTTRAELSEEPDAMSSPVLTGRDVAAGAPPSHGLAPGHQQKLEALHPGDVVVPSLLAGQGSPVAEVITAEGLLLGPNLQVLRPDPRRLDPHFLAGHLRAGGGTYAGVSASGVHRIDVRRATLPLLDLAEQAERGERFRRLREFERELSELARRGADLAQAYAGGLAEGSLQ